MKKPLITAVILLAFAFITSCREQDTTRPAQEKQVATGFAYKPFSPDQLVYGTSYEYHSGKSRQIADYVRRIFEDSRGNLWFGTNGLGVGRYDGDTLVYFSTREGLSGSQVTAILEDRRGNMWFSTTEGISSYDGKLFTSFTEQDGLGSNRVWSLYEDSRGTIWAGTVNGLSSYSPREGAKFSPFTLPQVEVPNPKPRFSTRLVSSIMEDKRGDLWFGTDGAGVFKYNRAAEKTGGKTFTHLSTKDGLSDNSIVSILEDREGNIWFSSRFGGLSRYTPSATTGSGKSFTSFTVANGSIGNNEVWTMAEDSAGTIWFSSEGFGIYRFKDNQLANFGKAEGLPIRAVQSIFEDRQGRLWIGGGGGLYLFNGEKFVEFTRDGFGEGC